jgi:hypothetical protein
MPPKRAANAAVIAKVVKKEKKEESASGSEVRHLTCSVSIHRVASPTVLMWDLLLEKLPLCRFLCTKSLEMHQITQGN